MRLKVMITLSGPDRVGIVEEVSAAVLAAKGNVETSRMVRLGGEFAVLMLVAVDRDELDTLERMLKNLTENGYRLTLSPTELTAPDGVAYELQVEGADHEGIVHEIAQGLAGQGITIESAETGVRSAAVSGAPLFWMRALVLVPADVDQTNWQSAVVRAADDANVDLTIASADD